MRRGVITILLIVLLLVLPIVFSEEVQSTFDEAKSYSWLKTATQNWDSLSIQDASLAILAFNNNGDDVSAGVSNLIAREDPVGCWPKDGCKVLDTAFATLALERSNKDVSKELVWLNDKKGALNPVPSTGNWLVQIEAPSNGICTVMYGANKTKDFTVEGNKVNNNWWIDVEKDLQSDLIRNSVSEKLDVNCGALSGALIISLLYKSGNNFFILEQHSESRATLTINNGCYGETSTSSGCHYISTMYAAWALTELDEEIATRAYLQSQIPASGDEEHAVVARITKKPLYLDYLKNEQEKTGAWGDGDSYITAFSVFAASANTDYSDVENMGVDYLKRTVANDGYWNNNVGDTAMALIALHGRDLERSSGSFSSIATNVTSTNEPEDCTNGIDDDSDGLADCFDGDCTDHSSCAEETTIEEECGDGICDLGEDTESCPSDCEEQTKTEPETGCTQDSNCQDNEKCNDKGECVKKFPWGIIVTILVVILILGGGTVFYLKFVKTGKLFKPKGSKPKPSFERYSMERPIQQPIRTAAQPSKKSKEEDELEKSLKEAEKLLYGKK